MAVVNLNALTNNNVTYDQNDTPGDNVLTANVLAGNTTLNITNTSDVTEPLILNQNITIGLASTQTVNVEEGATVTLSSIAGVSALSTFNYNLSEGATLNMTSAALSIGLANNTNIDMGENVASNLTYDTTGLNLELLSGTTGISNISPNDTIQVIGADGYTYNEATGALNFTSGGNVVARFDADGLDPDQIFFDGSTLTYACYLKGTHIATPEGEVKIEELKAGDNVLTASGGVATVKWLGFRKLQRNRLPKSDILKASPIRILKGALAENVPHRDLTVSPGHRFYFDGALIPALSLVNGQTIIQDLEVQTFEYFHVELEEFDMVLAEGAAAESYLDVGEYRSSFQNAKTVASNPDFGPAPEKVRLAAYVQKITADIIEPVRSALFKRAEIVTGAKRVFQSDLAIETEGLQFEGTKPGTMNGTYRFNLPENVHGDLTIKSNSSIVREVSLRPRQDTRRIGVGLTGIAIVDNNGRRELNLLDSELVGFNDAQEINGTTMRWTNGAAIIPASMLNTSGPAVLELTVLRTASYWVADVVTEAARKVA